MTAITAGVSSRGVFDASGADRGGLGTGAAENLRSGRRPIPHRRGHRAERKAHRARRDRRPPDVGGRIERAGKLVDARRQAVGETEDGLRYWHDQAHANSGLRGLSRARRDQRHTAAQQIEILTPALQERTTGSAAAVADRDALIAQQAARDRSTATTSWRVERIEEIAERRGHHWSDAVIQGARDGYPTAYGTRALLSARRTVAERIVSDSRSVSGSPHSVQTDRADLDILDRAIAEVPQTQGRVRVAAHPSQRPGRNANAPYQHIVHTDHPVPEHRGPSVGL